MSSERSPELCAKLSCPFNHMTCVAFRCPAKSPRNYKHAWRHDRRSIMNYIVIKSCFESKAKGDFAYGKVRPSHKVANKISTCTFQIQKLYRLHSYIGY